jgi:uncharacterized integral membrane protein
MNTNPMSEQGNPGQPTPEAKPGLGGPIGTIFGGLIIIGLAVFAYFNQDQYSWTWLFIPINWIVIGIIGIVTLIIGIFTLMGTLRARKQFG